jgi:putative transposase
MSRKYKIADQAAVYFVTFTVVRWLDVFIRREYKDIVIDSLRYCQKNKGLAIYSYCIMSSHVHLIIGSQYNLELQAIIRDMKKFTANRIIEAIENNSRESRREEFLWFFEREGRTNCHNQKYQFWQHSSHPIELDTEEKLYQRMDYIHYNPVKEGIVLSPEHYLYSSAMNYAGVKEWLIDVILI